MPLWLWEEIRRLVEREDDDADILAERTAFEREDAYR